MTTSTRLRIARTEEKSRQRRWVAALAIALGLVGIGAGALAAVVAISLRRARTFTVQEQPRTIEVRPGQVTKLADPLCERALAARAAWKRYGVGSTIDASRTDATGARTSVRIEVVEGGLGITERRGEGVRSGDAGPETLLALPESAEPVNVVSGRELVEVTTGAGTFACRRIEISGRRRVDEQMQLWVLDEWWTDSVPVPIRRRLSLAPGTSVEEELVKLDRR